MTIDKNTTLIKSNNGTYYEFLSNAGIILSKEGLNNSTQKRLDSFKQLNENIYPQKLLPLKKEYIYNETLKNSLSELVIEVTTKCNMRCKYCVFGEKYHELRTHGDKDMEFSTAKKAIDIYFDLFEKGYKYNPNRKPAVSFYGGEPLLNFDLIKKCVSYIKSIYKKDGLFITLTSNATLLTDEIIYFMKDNNITPLFSLDGPKTEHDKHRVKGGNVGTFDLVYKNLCRAYEIFEAPIYVNCVYSVDTDLSTVIDFFASHREFICINMAQVSAVDTTYFEDFTQEELAQSRERFKKLNKKFHDMILENKNKHDGLDDISSRKLALFNILLTKGCLAVIVRNMFQRKKPGVQYTSTCFPGDRIFVDVNGNFYPCEKLSRSRDIGNVYEGIDFVKITNYMNDYISMVNNKCASCKIKNFCSACYNVFLSESLFDNPEIICDDLRNSSMRNLIDYLDINELDDTLLGAFRIDYYKKIKELVVTLK